MKFKILCLMLYMLLVCSCSKTRNDHFTIPVNYTADAVMKVYTDNSENDYSINIICRNSNYSFKTASSGESWNMAFLSGNRCILNNDKFPENSVTLDNFNITDSLIFDFDLKKFDNSLDITPDELVYFDGTYKHVLNFSKENSLPSSILIYKNDNLVKSISYVKINAEEK